MQRALVFLAVICWCTCIVGQDSPSDRERALLDRIASLEQRIAALEARLPPPASAPAAPEQPTITTATAGTTFNVLLDGYYEYNFNRAPERVNLLRAFDLTSNSFSLNQAAVIVERAPDPAAGRRFGVRLDLMFGQATESLSGNPANEPRTAPYRDIYQAYGTYVFPIGTGLTVDFGRFSSPIGMESSFAKDQINYTRSLLFTALPFYHMGFRTSYKLNNSTTATWMLVNGLNQTEDFNGFKSNHFMLSSSLTKNVSWTGSYYVGQESRDEMPTHRLTHITDTYVTWTATPKLTLAGEADYIVNRPNRLTGGAGYLKYQFRPQFSVAGRFEYLSDRAYFTTVRQALRDVTLTATYQPADGFQIRWEYRRDQSDRRFFPTSTAGRLSKDQNTALMALLWWFGGKTGAW